MYEIRQREDGQWELLRDGEVIATAPTADDVRSVLAGIFATELAERDEDEEATGARFEAVWEEGDIARDDGGLQRIIEPGATSFDRSPPLAFMLITANEGGGHMGAALAGVIDEGSVDGSTVTVRGRLDAGSDAGQEAERLLRDGILDRHSPDYSETEWDFECVEEDEDGWCTQILAHMISGVVLGITMVPFPALDSARISLTAAAGAPTAGARISLIEEEGVEAQASGVVVQGNTVQGNTSLTVTAASVTVNGEEVPMQVGTFELPSAEWFEDPQLTEPTPLTIDEDGRIYGHAALWGTCHIGREDICMTPPTSVADYAYFRTGLVRCADDCEIPTGVITLGGGHADLSADHRRAASHYDDTGTGAADVAVGDDSHGIWVAGALRPGLSDDQIAELRASALSGDWRRIGGNLELVALLAVNVPGYPVVRTHVAAGDEQLALVAAGGSALAKRPEKWELSHAAHEERIAALERSMRGLRAIESMRREATHS
jgi:hypothetical protein